VEVPLPPGQAPARGPSSLSRNCVSQAIGLRQQPLLCAVSTGTSPSPAPSPLRDTARVGKDMNLSAAEQAVVEDMVAMRSVDLERPVWMQSHRMRIVQKEAHRRIAALPPPPKSPTGPSGVRTYWAARRVTGVPVGKYAIHESDGDLPICMLGEYFAAYNVAREQLPPGQVNCGHCAAKNA
jgi:hypothetical protein